MKMILKDVAVRVQSGKEGQNFCLIIEFERNGGGIQYCIIELEKGAEDEQVAERLEHLAHQVRGIR